MFCCLRTLGTFRTVLLVLTVRRIIFFLRTCSHSRHPSRGRRSCGNCRCRWSTFPACAVLARCRRAVSAGGGRPFLRCDTFCIFSCDDLSNSFQLLTPPLPLPYMGGECPAAPVRQPLPSLQGEGLGVGSVSPSCRTGVGSVSPPAALTISATTPLRQVNTCSLRNRTTLMPCWARNSVRCSS